MDDFIAELAAHDPHFDRGARRFMAERGRPRKMPVLCDENLEDDFIATMRDNRKFKVTTMPKGVSDSILWQSAQRRGLVLVTADEDFWDERRYPLRESPGLLLLRGRNAEERLAALVRIITVMDLPWIYARNPDFLLATKARVSAGGGMFKFLATDGRVVEDTL